MMRLRQPTRRAALTAALGLSLVWRPAAALSDELAGAVRGFTGGAPTREGRVKFEIEPLVENGNAVPITVSVDSPMTAADHVREIAIFNDGNPLPEVVRFELSPRNGRAEVAIGIRLATTQQLVAVARLSDGSHWTHTVDVVVTLAACLE